ncbi:MAG TPA: hypothetical protein VM871_05190 [Flavisolibacter sp.]|jgi:hypothetical protein|nr:hypothetical protein [Flavisolibacter sp.]
MLQTAFAQNSIQKHHYKIVTAKALSNAKYTVSLVKEGEAEPAPEK